MSIPEDLRDYLSADCYPDLPEEVVEEDVAAAFVEGIIAEGLGKCTFLEAMASGMAFQLGWRFSNRWGERGTDLACALKWLQEESNKKHRAEVLDE